MIDGFTQAVAVALAESVGREATDPAAHLAAGLLMTTWIVAAIQAHQIFRQNGDVEAAKKVFLTLVDMGAIGLKSAMAGTPYA